MKRIFFAALALILTTPSWAVLDSYDNSTNATAQQAQGQGQAQGQLQGQGQAQSSSSNSLSGAISGSHSSAGASSNQSQSVDTVGSGNSTVTNVTNPPQTGLNYSGAYKVRNVPDVYAPAMSPTSTCMSTTSAGGSAVGFGLSFGTTTHDENCERRENARMLIEMGMRDEAVQVLCLQGVMKAARICSQFVEPAKAAAKANSAGVVTSSAAPSLGW